MTHYERLTEAIGKIKPWLELFFEPGQRTELRILEALDRETGHKHTDAGFFEYANFGTMIRVALGSYEGRCKGAYVVLNPIKPDAHTKKTFKNACQTAKRDDLTSDADIQERRWLLVDIDPVRPTSISATDAEKQAACELSSLVRRYLESEFGASPTIVMDSGNGYHLYYRLAEPLPVVLPLRDDDIIAQCLRHLSERFDTPQIKIDKNVFNPSRIVKMVGTRSCKGVDTPERPHRRARIVTSERGNRISLDSLQRLASLAPPLAKPTPSVTPIVSVASKSKVIAYAKKYLGTLDPAVSGNHGHDQTYHAAATLRVRFDLAFDEAWPIMLEFNEKCVPPWTESELEKKLMDADHAEGTRGDLIPDILRDPSQRKNRATSKSSAETVQEGTCDAPTTFCNFRLDDMIDGETTKQVKVGLSCEELHKRLISITNGWPRRVGTMLFAEGPSLRPIWIDSASGLFAYIHGMLSGHDCGLNWARGDKLVVKDEFFRYLKMHAESYVGIEKFPHMPSMKGIYYMHPPVQGGDGTALAGLLKEFCPSTFEDSVLIRAFFVTLFWGGPVGARPAWLFCAEENDAGGGRGVGKTSIAKMAEKLLESAMAMSPNDNDRDVQARLLSPAGLESRLVIFDNLKSLHLSSSMVEALLTMSTISGRALFVGEASRPNHINWVLTFNEPSFSKDLSQRCVEIRVARPLNDPGWVTRVCEYIDANRWAIVGDCLAILAAPEKPLTAYTRWASWEGQVLSKLLIDPADTDKLITTIEERRKETDDDDVRACDYADAIRTVLRRESFCPDTQKIRIYNTDMANIINSYTRKNEEPARVSKFIASLKIPELEKFRTTKTRGFVWNGPESPKSAQVVTFKVAAFGT